MSEISSEDIKDFVSKFSDAEWREVLYHREWYRVEKRKELINKTARIILKSINDQIDRFNEYQTLKDNINPFESWNKDIRYILKKDIDYFADLDQEKISHAIECTKKCIRDYSTKKDAVSATKEQLFLIENEIELLGSISTTDRCELFKITKHIALRLLIELTYTKTEITWHKYKEHLLKQRTSIINNTNILFRCLYFDDDNDNFGFDYFSAPTVRILPNIVGVITGLSKEIIDYVDNVYDNELLNVREDIHFARVYHLGRLLNQVSENLKIE